MMSCIAINADRLRFSLIIISYNLKDRYAQFIGYNPKSLSRNIGPGSQTKVMLNIDHNKIEAKFTQANSKCLTSS